MRAIRKARRRAHGVRERFGFAAGLAAIYVPVAGVLLTPWPPANKALALVSCWALEGIVWFWRSERSTRRTFSSSPPRANG
ncbi:MAG TPA: hypothetical protein VMA83_01860 [Solirubrobacteraceae bacterium]|nr:hypothetical protein [Solirubrobacteraceae bacterium]